MAANKTIGIVGSGQMGRGIAQVLAFAGFETIIYDIKSESLEFAFKFIEAQLLKGAEKNKWSIDQATSTLKRIKLVNSLTELAHCSLVIEAATENKSVKFDLFQKLDEICHEDTILASNTSSISITEIAKHTKRADKVCGMHFMNPVPVMKLVEAIRGLETSALTMSYVKEVVEALNKTYVESKDIPGFIVNRILAPMLNEAIFALYEGIGTKEDIDNAMVLGTNQPMGPLKLADFIGLDTCLAILEVLYDGLGDPKYRPCPLLKQYVAAGRLGLKVKKGFYEYE